MLQQMLVEYYQVSQTLSAQHVPQQMLVEYYRVSQTLSAEHVLQQMLVEFYCLVSVSLDMLSLLCIKEVRLTH